MELRSEDASDAPITAPTPLQPSVPHGAAHDTLHALAKDLRSVTRRSQALHEQAQRAKDTARALCARLLAPPPPALDLRLTVPQACLAIGICERTLRIVLRETGMPARTEQARRKAGTFYKNVLLLPPDLVEELRMRFLPKQRNGPATL